MKVIRKQTCLHSNTTNFENSTRRVPGTMDQPGKPNYFTMKKYLFILLLILGMNNAAIPQQEKGQNISYNNFRNEPAFLQKIDINHIDYQLMAQVIFHLTNEIRVRNKLNLLEYSEELEKSASMHAQDMVSQAFFDHINSKDSKKRTPNDRAKLCGVSNPFLAENIIEGYALQYQSLKTVYLRGKGKFSASPNGALIEPHTYLSFGEAQLTGWMNSKDHRKNILSKEALQIGCGAAYFVNKSFNDMPSLYVVQNFQWYKPIMR
jgi:uncharacterized protein YkwD